MAEFSEGATKIYNRINNPDENDSRIVRLRDLHHKLDESVMNAYGWNDLRLSYSFTDESHDDDSDEESSTSKRKKYRYKLLPDLHDEILARLIKLNQERYENEVRLGLHKK